MLLVLGLFVVIAFVARSCIVESEPPRVAVGETLAEVQARLGPPDHFVHRMDYPVGVGEELVIHLDDAMVYDRAGELGPFDGQALPFEAADWRERDSEDRQDLCADLLAGGHLEELDRDGVLELLGPPVREVHWQSYYGWWPRWSAMYIRYGRDRKVFDVDLMLDVD